MLVKLDLRKKAACIAEQYHTVQKLQAPPMSTLKKRFCANRENLQPNQPPGKKPFLHNLLTRSATRPVAARGWQLRSVALWLFRKRSLPHCYWNRWQIQCNSILHFGTGAEDHLSTDFPAACERTHANCDFSWRTVAHGEHSCCSRTWERESMEERNCHILSVPHHTFPALLRKWVGKNEGAILNLGEQGQKLLL